jgi:hypothetical protein
MFANTFRYSFVLASSVLAFGLLEAKANLVQNGSFESPAEAADSTSSDTPDNWSGGYQIINGDGGGFYPSPEDGSQYVDLAPGFSISQIFSVPTTGDYILSWFDNGLPGLDYTINVFAGPLDPPFTSTGGTWNEHSMSIHLPAGFASVRFSVDDTESADIFLDNVRIESAQVPDVGNTFGLLSVAFGCVAAFGRKFRRNA